MCEYTSHGHCGIIEKGAVKNDATLELLAKEAVSHAKAGADMAAPSDMMDGRVKAIRIALDSGVLRDTNHELCGKIRISFLWALQGSC